MGLIQLGNGFRQGQQRDVIIGQLMNDDTDLQKLAAQANTLDSGARGLSLKKFAKLATRDDWYLLAPIIKRFPLDVLMLNLENADPDTLERLLSNDNDWSSGWDRYFQLLHLDMALLRQLANTERCSPYYEERLALLERWFDQRAFEIEQALLGYRSKLKADQLWRLWQLGHDKLKPLLSRALVGHIRSINKKGKVDEKATELDSLKQLFAAIVKAQPSWFDAQSDEDQLYLFPLFDDDERIVQYINKSLPFAIKTKSSRQILARSLVYIEPDLIERAGLLSDKRKTVRSTVIDALLNHRNSTAVDFLRQLAMDKHTDEKNLMRITTWKVSP